MLSYFTLPLGPLYCLLGLVSRFYCDGIEFHIAQCFGVMVYIKLSVRCCECAIRLLCIFSNEIYLREGLTGIRDGNAELL